MKTRILDPLQDPRWDVLISSHPRASVFHTSAWLRALAKTYGYRPVGITTSADNEPLADSMVYCEVTSWITGSRLVSLPFSDHCEFLTSLDADPAELDRWIQSAYSPARWKYLELRPISWVAYEGSALRASQSFWFHTLDLTPSSEQLFNQMHKSCMQRRVRHAEHEALVCDRGRSERLLRDFYKLLMKTRRRHRLLPQPLSWFRNLIAELGPNIEILLARKSDVPVAAILIMRHRKTVVYKYGCSDHRFHHLAGMPFLFWRLIEESKAEGMAEIDFGRTDLTNRGLVEFKDRLGAGRRMIRYLRHPANETMRLLEPAEMSVQRSLISYLPNAVSSGMGQLVYRHFA